MKILIVEDERRVRQMLQAQILASARDKADILLGSAESLAEALEWMLENEPDLVICDGLFPIGTISERTFRNLSETQHWVVIWALALVNHKTFALLTGDAGILARARAMGVAGFPKPEGVDAVIRYALGDQGRKRSSGKPRKS